MSHPWDWDYLIHKHLSGEELTEEQRSALNDRLRKFPRLRKRLAEMAFEQAQMRDVLATSEGVPILIVPDTVREPAAVAAAPLLKPLPPIPWYRRPWILPAAAAAGFLVLVLGIVAWRNSANRAPFEVVKGEVRAEGGSVEVSAAAPALFRMSDGSEAELSPSSTAVFRGRVGDARQVVELNAGAGRFKVAKAPDTFKIETPAGRVTVLGTEFTVELRKQKKRPAAMAVSVTEGRVRVDARGEVRELGPGERHVFGAEPEEKRPEEKKPQPPPERKEARPVFNGVVRGKVVGKGDAHVLIAVDAVVSSRKDAAPDLAAAMPGRTIKVMVPGPKRKEGEPEVSKIPFLYVRKLAIGQEVSLDVRQTKGEDFMIGELDREQADWAVREERREGDKEPKKKARDPEKSPERDPKKED